MFQESHSDPPAPWPQRFAHRVAPDEIDIADDLAAAYAAGGAKRQQLFLRPRTDPGSFGIGVGLLLPYLWQALDTAYPLLRAVLSDPVLANVLSIAGLVLSCRRHPGEAHPTEAVRPAGAAADSLDAAIDHLRDRLAAAGLPVADAEQKAIDVVEVMLADPESATSFLGHLANRS